MKKDEHARYDIETVAGQIENECRWHLADIDPERMRVLTMRLTSIAQAMGAHDDPA